MKEKKTWKIAVAGLGIILLVIALPLIAAFGKSGRDTKVLGRNYSVLSKKEIEAKLELDFPMAGTIKLGEAERIFEVDLASISAEINTGQTASKMLFRRLRQGIGPYFKAFFDTKDFELTVEVNEEKLEQEIAGIEATINKPYIPTEIVLGAQMSVKEGQIGREVETEALKNLILKKLARYDLEKVSPIPAKDVGFLPSEEEKKEALDRARKWLGKELKLEDRETELTVDSKTLISWIKFGGGVEEMKVNEYIATVAPSLKREAQNAVFKFENGRVVEFKPDRPGFYLDEAKLKNIIFRNYLNWEQSGEKILKEELPLVKSEAEVKTGEVNNLGIKELLGKGTSTFHHSSEVRNVNIRIGAATVNQILVAPGEEFSFNKNLGEVSREKGYTMAYIIRAGRTELDLGGGICQVSTTLFRAMLDAGVQITQRRPHAYRVGYYEEDSPPGYDATVFLPSPDLRFKNDTGNYLLIQSYYDGVNKKLTYEIYGTNDGREVEISNYKQWGAAAAPPDVYIDDPNLPAGKIVKVESRVPGLNTSFDWTVRKNGEILHQQTFVSKYVPWAAVYRRGIGQ